MITATISIIITMTTILASASTIATATRTATTTAWNRRMWVASQGRERGELWALYWDGLDINEFWASGGSRSGVRLCPPANCGFRQGLEVAFACSHSL